MAKSGEVLDIPELGIRIRFLQTAAETGGELAQFEASGRPRGFLNQEHVHAGQTELLEPLTGAIEVVAGGGTTVLHPGDAHEIPAGTPHTQRPIGDGDGTLRITVRPAARSEEFLEKLAELSRDGRLLKGGWPRPTAAAELIRDFGDAGLASKPPPAVQRAVATGILTSARAGRAVVERAANATGNEYLFVDEWDVAAPPRAVFEALADARTYPRWWTPVYLDVDADGPPKLGKVSRQHFKGRLPYHLHTESTITRLEPPHVVEGDVTGDLRGPRHVDADADGHRHPRPLRLARVCRPQAAAPAHPPAAARVPLEPQLGHRARDGGPRAVRPQHGRERRRRDGRGPRAARRRALVARLIWTNRLAHPCEASRGGGDRPGAASSAGGPRPSRNSEDDGPLERAGPLRLRRRLRRPRPAGSPPCPPDRPRPLSRTSRG